MSGNVTEQNNKGELMDGLPRQFVSSLRILFDILDEHRTGLVRLKDIETRWSDDGVRGLPAGVVDGLRRVSPSDGLLTFDRFVAGLKLVLKRRQGSDLRKSFTSKEIKVPPVNDFVNKVDLLQTDATFRENRFYGNESPPAYTAQRRFNSPQNTGSESTYNSITAKKNDQRHNHDSQMVSGRVNEFNRDALGQSSHRPQREESPSRRAENNSSSTYTIKADVRNYPTNMGSHHGPSKQTAHSAVYSATRTFSRNPHQSDTPPSVPPRTVTSNAGSSGYVSSQMKKSHSGPELQQFITPPALPPRQHHPNSHILTDLRNWQKEWTANQNYAGESDQSSRRQRVVPSGNTNSDNAIYANIEQYQRKSEESKHQSPQRVTVRRHGSGRRHTLSSGIDHNMLKRMRQLEEEKVILESGLAKVDSTREWYLKQLALLGDRQAMLGKVPYNDNSLEAHQERMSFQKARIAEVNQQLQALIESSEKGFPLHMNLAMTSRAVDQGNELTLIMKNRKLMEDMNYKSSQISQLEKEKATLIRELFEARSKNKPVHDDTTFM